MSHQGNDMPCGGPFWAVAVRSTALALVAATSHQQQNQHQRIGKVTVLKSSRILDRGQGFVFKANNITNHPRKAVSNLEFQERMCVKGFPNSIIHGNHSPQVGDHIRKCRQGSKAFNPYMALLEDADGLKKLEALQQYYDKAIYTKADLILSSFYDVESSTGAIRQSLWHNTGCKNRGS